MKPARYFAELWFDLSAAVRAALLGRPDADALAAAAQCPDFVEPPEYDAAGPTELDLTWHSIQSARVQLSADSLIHTGAADKDMDLWDVEFGLREDWS